MVNIPIYVCKGEISDIFRTSRYGPTTELELPDTERSEEEFQHFLRMYRISLPVFADIIFGWSQKSDPGWWSY